MITTSSIDNLKSNLDIIDVIGASLKLEKNGANYKCLCPFHEEDTPSFVVSPSKQIYHCFSCDVGGNAITFLMEFEKLSYPEALEKLADMYSVKLEYDRSNEKNIDYTLIQSVQNHFCSNLKFNKQANDYLMNRGVNEQSIEKFNLGLAYSSKDIISFLQSNSFDMNSAKEFGIVDFGDNGTYSRFIDRIIFPINATNGKVVGFGGRTIKRHDAKYLNSPQTKFFNKSKLLYGYNLARHSIYQKKEIIVTEGYLDTIMLHQGGYSNTVATLGTSLTKEHLPLLKKGEPRVILAYDGDKAGYKAGYKASMLLSSGNFDGGVIVLKDGLDPADMIMQKRETELNALLSNPKPFVEFVIDYIVMQCDLKNIHQKQKALSEIIEYFRTLKPIYEDEYKEYISQAINIDKKYIIFNRDVKKQKTNNNSKKIDLAELLIIKSILHYKAFDIIEKNLKEEYFSTHLKEFNILQKNPNNLEYLFLNEEIRIYSVEHLKEAICKLIVHYLNKQLLIVKSDTLLRTTEKILKTKGIQEKIKKLKNGELSEII